MSRDDNDRAQAGEDILPDDDLGPVEQPPGDPPILVQGSQWYVRDPDTGGYATVSERLLHQHLERVQPGLERYTYDDEGKPRQMSRPELYQRYGRRIDDVTYELAGRSRFEPNGPDGGTMVVGVCHPIDVAPEFDVQIAEWLRLLGGDHPERLLDWLSVVHRLDQPCAALYLRGPKDAGKSMLAMAVSRGFGQHTASYDDAVLGSYSGALLRSPVLLVEERVAQIPGVSGPAAFRAAVTATSRPLTEKYKPSGTLRGCVRIVITANDDNALLLGDDEGLAGEDAIGERVLRCVSSPAITGLLEGWGGWDTTRHWVESGGEPGAIWRHIAWLREHHTLSRPPRRLLVYGEPAQWLAGVAARSGMTREILIAVARSALRVVAMPDGASPPYVAKGAVVVSVQDLHKSWTALTGDSRPPTVARLGGALRKLASRTRAAGTDRRWCYPIDVALVEQVVADTGCVQLAEWQALTRPPREPGDESENDDPHEEN